MATRVSSLTKQQIATLLNSPAITSAKPGQIVIFRSVSPAHQGDLPLSSFRPVIVKEPESTEEKQAASRGKIVAETKDGTRLPSMALVNFIAYTEETKAAAMAAFTALHTKLEAEKPIDTYDAELIAKRFLHSIGAYARVFQAQPAQAELW